MTRDEFKSKSNELFFQISKSLCQEMLESAKPIYDKAIQKPNKEIALHQINSELSQMMSQLCFEASCDYSEKLALLLFDQFSK